jgi:hypothetical protein
MKWLKAFVTRPFPQALASLPGGSYLVAGFYVVAALCLNGSLAYSLVSGRIPQRLRFEWIEARESSPGLYWAYIAGLGVVILFLDGLFVYGVWKSSNEPKA